jgi:hypothetical protein
MTEITDPAIGTAIAIVGVIELFAKLLPSLA